MSAGRPSARLGVEMRLGIDGAAASPQLEVELRLPHIAGHADTRDGLAAASPSMIAMT